MRPFMKISILFIFFLFCGLIDCSTLFRAGGTVEGQSYANLRPWKKNSKPVANLQKKRRNNSSYA